MPPIPGDLLGVSLAWDVDELFARAFEDEEGIRQTTAAQVDLLRDYAPDVVVDSFGFFSSLAAHILGIPMVSVLQGSFHPASEGFLWGKGDRPQDLPTLSPIVNRILAEHNIAPVNRAVDLLAGELALIVGTPETDPVPGAEVTHVGPIVWQRGNGELPDWVARLNPELPLIWIYPGNPRYAGAAASTACDSIVVIQAAIEALGESPFEVVLTSGHQELPAEIALLPANFHHAAYLPGPAMAERSDLMIHHGGHSSVMAGLAAGKPAVMVPTISERECNARRLAALGAGEIVFPVNGADGEKSIDIADFRAKIQRVLSEPCYREAAARVAASMRQYGGAAQAADLIEEFAELAAIRV
jgi:UDP:flavonoid glycosyltransferase YjiC (YdhE family)